MQLYGGRVALLDRGDDIVRDARLETDNVGEMALAMDDGSQLVLSPNSEIVIDRFVYDPARTSGQAVFSLARGALRMISGRMRSDRYRLRTPVATIGIRGTDFTTEVVNGLGMIVRVDEGEVEISPNGTTNRFTVSAGQESICTQSGCRDAGPGERRTRRARLGPPIPQPPRQRLDTGGARGQATQLAALGEPATELACPPYRIPERAYRRIGLDPARWPSHVDGITFYRHGAGGVETKLYCPDRITPANDQSFTVQGRAADGETRTLYYVNSLPGQDLFQPGYDRFARELQDARAYRAYMSRILADEPGHQVIESTAELQETAPNRIVLTQSVDVRVPYGSYLVTGVTLFRPAAGNRTGLFAVPAVVVPRPSGKALTAMRIGRPLFSNLDGG
ncbi:MAG: FecR domain-containing protein [Pseudomonadota bacterium]